MKTNTGLLMNIIVGIVGALIGNFLFDMLIGRSGEGSVIGQLVVAVIGAREATRVAGPVRPLLLDRDGQLDPVRGPGVGSRLGR